MRLFLEGPAGIRNLPVAREKALHFLEVALVEESQRRAQFLEFHVVLGERARLVRQEILDAAQFLRDVRVPGHGALNVPVVVDAPGVVQLREVHVHLHGNGDDAGQDDEHPREEDPRVQVGELPAEEGQQEGQEDQDPEEVLGQRVDVLVGSSELGARLLVVQFDPRLLAHVDHQSNSLPGRQLHVGP